MSNPNYFQRLYADTPTRFWINNPTREEARLAIANGALGCTTNPSHLAKMLASPQEGALARQAVEQAVAGANSASQAAALAQRTMVAHLMREFEPVYKKSGGRHGYVSIQADPFTDDDADSMIREGEEDLKLGENVILKIPVTEAGLKVIEYFVAKGKPVLATEVMGVPQMVAVCELYKKAAGAGSVPFYVTHITGIFTEHLKTHLAGVPADMVSQAGLAVARRQYALMKQRAYPGVLMGGGARTLDDFTGLVGADAVITINWKGTADKLLELDGEVAGRIDEKTPDKVLNTLMAQEVFRQAWNEDGMGIGEFAGYGPVQLFRSMFVDGWNKLLAAVEQAGKREAP